MKKFAVILLAAALLGGCGTNEVQPDISETSQTETTTAVTTTAEKVTTAKVTTVTTEEAIPLTPLEEARAWADEYPYRFLYDFTGDGFPEGVNLPRGEFVDFDGYITGPADDYICTDGEIYICRDNDGRIFAATFYNEDYMAGHIGCYASRYDFYSNCLKETILGKAEVFFRLFDYSSESEREYYTAEFGFLGDSSERAGLIKSPAEDVSDSLKKRLMEYISGYELIDTIILDFGESKEYTVNFGADTDFAEKPSDNLPEYKITEIAVGNHMYDSNHNYVRIDEEVLAKGFDFDVLNEFENLDYVCFDGILENPDEKIKIPKGDWRGKIKKMRIDITDWNTSDLSDFTNIESIIVDGCNIENSDLEFLKDMPSVRYIYAYFNANSAEDFIPLSEMPKLEAIIDSGHGSCMENLSEEEQEKVMELLPKYKYFWGMVK